MAVFVEVEGGRREDRPELLRALEACRLYEATLVIAELGRLARHVAFVSAVMESGVDFLPADNPHATRLTIHILAAVAEDEAERISDRTRAASAAAKARGQAPRGFPRVRPRDADRAAAAGAEAAGAQGRATILLPATGRYRRPGSSPSRALPGS